MSTYANLGRQFLRSVLVFLSVLRDFYLYSIKELKKITNPLQKHDHLWFPFHFFSFPLAVPEESIWDCRLPLWWRNVMSVTCLNNKYFTSFIFHFTIYGLRKYFPYQSSFRSKRASTSYLSYSYPFAYEDCCSLYMYLNWDVCQFLQIPVFHRQSCGRSLRKKESLLFVVSLRLFIVGYSLSSFHIYWPATVEACQFTY